LKILLRTVGARHTLSVPFVNATLPICQAA
jgi:hypothetical protein